ncbi:MAG: hypothetical protein ACRD4C_02885 [Candidatus Acidiferrales bacterium]
MDLTGLGAIGNVLLNWWISVREDKQIQAWLKFFTSLVVSGVISGCGLAGLALMAGRGWLDACGVGLVSLAAAWFGVCSVSPIGRDLIQSLPKAFITQMQEHPDQVTIVGSEEKKK